MTSVSRILLALTGAVAVVEVAFVLAARPRIALGAFMVMAVVDTTTVNFSAHFGSLHIYPDDVVCFAAAVSVMLRVMLNWGRRPSASMSCMLALWALALIRGAQQFGIQAATNEGREVFYFLVTALYLSTVHVDFSFILSLRRWFLAAAVFLTGGACIFWLQHGFGTYGANGNRALNGNAALIVLGAALSAVVLPFGHGRMRWLVPVVGFGVLLLSDQRTVWAAAVVAIAVLYFLSARAGALGTKRTLAAAVATGVGALALVLASGTGGVDKSLTTAASSSFSGNGTFSWRVQGWVQLLQHQIHRPLFSIGLGNPAGTGFLRTVDGVTFNLAPHSEYVELLLTAGVVGLTILVFTYGSLLRRLARLIRRARADRGIAALALSALLVAELVYFTTYSIGISGGVILGAALGLARTRPKVKQTRVEALSVSR